MDVEMPIMDGITATGLIKSSPETAAIPVIIFTSLGSENDMKRARDAGCNGFLNKPVCKDELQTAVNAAMGVKG
jgi:CheY-like chemotaxis protein